MHLNNLPYNKFIHCSAFYSFAEFNKKWHVFGPMKNGFFVSCVLGKEKRAAREIITCLESLELPCEAEPTDFSIDFAKQLDEELKQFKKKKRFYKFVESKSIVFIGNTTELAPSVLHKMIKEKNPKFRSVIRIIPLDMFGQLSSESISKFVQDRSFDGSFKITYQGRLCPSNTKQKVFESILPNLSGKVSLDNPEWQVLVQAYTSYIGISILQSSQCLFNFAI